MPVLALLLDFNGTISDDEGLQCEIYRGLFTEHGRPLSEAEYFGQLAGFSDAEIIERWLGPGHPAAAEVLAERLRRFQAVAADGSTVPEHIREAIVYAATHTRLGLVSGAARVEVQSVLHAAGIDVFDPIVTMEDVEHGKPAPDGYLRALALLGVSPAEAVAIEDAAPGIAAAHAAGLRCVAVRGTMSTEQLAAADEVAPRLDRPLVERLLAWA